MFVRLKVNSTYSPLKALLVIVFCVVLAACNQEQSATPATTVQSAEAKAKAQADLQAAQKAEAVLATMSSDELRKLASTAFREQRLYAPAGNNALEYYLAIRKKTDQPDVLTESALMDLAPYTVIAAEQAIASLDFNEASRLRDLIASVDASAPALPRISQAIADGMKNTETLVAADAKQRQQALLAAEQAAFKTNQELLKPEVATKVALLPAAIASQATPTPVTTAQVQIPLIAPTPSVIAAKPVVTKKAELIAIRTPDPSFPSDALNRGLSGAVEIEFIVQRSGEVSEVRVVNSNQRAFDRNVVSTVKRWKFAPLDEPMTVRRSFNFNNPS